MELSEEMIVVSANVWRADEEAIVAWIKGWANKVVQLEVELREERETRRRWGVEGQDALDAQRRAEAENETLRVIILNCHECRRTIQGLFYQVTDKALGGEQVTTSVVANDGAE